MDVWVNKNEKGRKGESIFVAAHNADEAAKVCSEDKSLHYTYNKEKWFRAKSSKAECDRPMVIMEDYI